jgi:tetratricopeptide (TPR) repeat protein/tRNA A-37 threonylcarbamoyl transferase component Bud32
MPHPNPTDSTVAPADSDAGTGTHEQTAGSTDSAGRRYVLGDEIARGGMGTVYRATDTVLGREVAVKVLLDKYAPDSGTARRFHDEARIAGQLQHPNIPAVHDLGTLPDGRPFLAMKLIKGDTLEALLAARPDPASDRGRFVAAFEQVCQGVAYAHAHNVIHRDLKPANVMVGNFGEVQVMDWGLAKVVTERPSAEADDGSTAAGTVVASLRDSDGSFTQAGSVLGTPAFMPPEQAVGAVGKVNVRSDVFGLGATLAVILTGQPPFAAGSAETTRVKAATGNIADCFARLDGCGADPELVALCKRCLSPQPEDRPADADEVAEAVARLRVAADERARRAEVDRVRLEGERTTAQAQAAERRWRRRLWLGASAVTVVLTVGGLAAVLVVQRRANAEQGRKNAELAAANERERQRFDLAMEAVGAFHTGASEDVLLKQSEFEPLRKKLLGGAAEFYRKLQGQLGDAADARSHAAMAKAYAGLGGAARAVGSTEQALQDYGQSRELYESLAAADPADPTPRRELVRVLMETYSVHDDRKELNEKRQVAERAATQAEELATTSGDPQDVSLWIRGLVLLAASSNSPDDQERTYARATELGERLVADHPHVAEYQARLGSALRGLAIVDYLRGKYEECAQFCARAALACEASRQIDPADGRNRRTLALAYETAGLAIGRLGRDEEALAEFRRALQVLEELTAEQPAVIEYQQLKGREYQNVAWALSQLGRTEEAGQSSRRQVAVVETLVARHPDRPDLQNSLAFALTSAGAILAETGQEDEAILSYQRAVDLLQALVKAYSKEHEYRRTLGQTLQRLGYVQRGTGKSDEATAAFERARDAFAAVLAERPTDVAARTDLIDSWRALGWHLGRSGRLAEGLTALGRARELAEHLASEHPTLPGPRLEINLVYGAIGNVLFDSGDEAGAAAAYQQALAVAEQLATEYPKVPWYRSKVARQLCDVGLSHQRAGRLAEARAVLTRCRDVWEQVATESPKVLEYRDELGRALDNLGSLEALAGDRATALPLQRKAVAVCEKVVAEAPKNTGFQRGLGDSLTDLGQTYRRLGKPVEAGQALERALGLVEPLLKQKTLISVVQVLHLETRLQLGILRLSENKPAEAAGHFAQAVKATGGRLEKSVDELVRLAGIHAQTSRLSDAVVASEFADVPEVPKDAKAHADRAMAVLSKAVEKGFGDVLLLTRSDAYDPLRDRDDFKKLLATMKAKQVSKPEKQP